jgi:hypothetical protein
MLTPFNYTKWEGEVARAKSKDTKRRRKKYVFCEEVL